MSDLLKEVLNKYKSVFGKPLYLSPPNQQRVQDFIDRLKELYHFTDEQILKGYDYVLRYYKDKGYTVRPGALCTTKIIQFMFDAKSGVLGLPLYYHPLYQKRPTPMTPPYDEKIRRNMLIAKQLYEAQKVIYVPAMGLVLEMALHQIAQVVNETGHWAEDFELIEKIYTWYRDLGSKYRHRDEKVIWRKRPFWKALMPKELFTSPIGPLRYREVEYLLDCYDRLSPKFPRDINKFIDIKLRHEFEEFSTKYSDYLWMLPEPRKVIVPVIDRFIRKGL